MTLIVGWKRNNTVFIAGDSVATYESSPSKVETKTTSFSETLVHNEEQYIIDTSLKVAHISDNLVVGCAGSTWKCSKFLSELKYRIQKLDRDIISIINDTLDDYARTTEISFIFGISVNGKTSLLSYNDNEVKKTELIEKSHFTYAGSIDIIPMRLINYFVYGILKQGFDESKTLVSICAILQGFTLRNPQIERGIGGFFAGILINGKEVSWLEDTTFLIYNVGFPISNEGIHVNVAIRDNGAFLHTSQVDAGNKIFLNLFDEDKRGAFTQWYDKHFEETERKMKSADTKFLVFLHSTKPIVSILTPDYKEYVKSIYRKDGVCTFGFDGAWIRKLFTEPVFPGIVGYPFQFNYAWH